MLLPKNTLIYVLKIRNGPNGIVPPLKCFFLYRTSMIATKAPVKNARYSEIRMLGNPKKIPITPTSFTSPNPIPTPLVTKYKERKNREAIAPDNIIFIQENGKMKWKRSERSSSGSKISSGKMPYQRSIKNKMIKQLIMTSCSTRKRSDMDDCKKNNRPIRLKLLPVTISISGYFHPIHLWQYRHFPCKNRKENKGNKSYHAKAW